MTAGLWQQNATARRTRILAGGTILVCALVALAFSASPARAATTWWHLSSGTRPTYLQAGAGRPAANEEVELTVKVVPGKSSRWRG